MAFLPDVSRLLLLIVVFVPLEKLLSFRPEQLTFRRNWRNDLIYYVVNGPIIGVGVAAIVTAAIVLGRLLPAGVQDAIVGQPIWLQLLEVFLIADAGFYAAHLAFHKIPVLWRFHAVHHSIEELDWLAAHRVHPIDQIITKGCSVFPIFVLGFSDLAIAIFAAVYGWHSILLHANVRIELGPLRWIVASPEFHHWHHANAKEAHNKNFAGQLSLLDWIFGTAYMPRDRTPDKYGTNYPVPGSFLDQMLHPFRRQAGAETGNRESATWNAGPVSAPGVQTAPAQRCGSRGRRLSRTSDRKRGAGHRRPGDRVH